MPIEKLVLAKEGGGKEETGFLNHLLGEARLFVVQVPLPSLSKPPALPRPRETSNGKEYEFVASKVFDDGMEPWGGKKKCLRMVYAAVAGEDLPPISLQDELEKLADWCALPNARKVASRLELLQSPGKAYFELRPGEPLRPEMFERIDEPLTEESGGCGFIPSRMLEQLLAEGKERVPIAAKRATNVQVRIFITRVGASPDDLGGVWKGVLTAKPGIDKIQLPPSMHKVDMHMRVVGMHMRVVGLHMRVVGMHMYKVDMHMRVVGMHMRVVDMRNLLRTQRARDPLRIPSVSHPHPIRIPSVPICIPSASHLYPICIPSASRMHCAHFVMTSGLLLASHRAGGLI
jgi:hypothetical protein